jgi:iron-sulfur cluster repair protein YtfE (RIC family)
MKSFSELLELHREIDEVFFAHQCSLLHFEFGAALSLLERYESALLRHMQDEEDLLLPLYAGRAAAIKAGAPQIFLDDHAKMRAFVDLFKEQTAKLAANARPESVLLMLLDREAFYKRLCSHHDKREREILYPALDELTSEAEKIELLARVMLKVDLARSSMTS